MTFIYGDVYTSEINYHYRETVYTNYLVWRLEVNCQIKTKIMKYLYAGLCEYSKCLLSPPIHNVC